MSDALSVSWARAANKIGKGTLADHLGLRDPKLINRALTGETVPELHTALNSLRADDTALDEVFHLYGFHPPRAMDLEARHDMETVSDLSATVARWLESLRDGKRDHRETLALADLIREVLPPLTLILDEADRIRGAKTD